MRGRNRKLVLDVDAAEEVVQLIDDDPGTADEQLLDQALDALQAVRPRIAPDDQKRIAEGELVAVELSPAAIDALTTLIVDNRATRQRTLRRIGGRLRSKVRQATRRDA